VFRSNCYCIFEKDEKEFNVYLLQIKDPDNKTEQ
jgi:hypothetical protein